MDILIAMLAIIAAILFVIFCAFIYAAAKAAAYMDDLMQSRICPDCQFNQVRCDFDPRTCKYAKNKTPKES